MDGLLYALWTLNVDTGKRLSFATSDVRCGGSPGGHRTIPAQRPMVVSGITCQDQGRANSK